MFSIVIPSKNEEKAIGILLKSIREQTIQPNKIVLSDKSSDHTRDIAKQYGVEIVDGEDSGFIGKARNTGSAQIDDDIIIFLDADTELPTCTFLEDTITCFEALELDIASCYYRSQNSCWKGQITFAIFNFIKKLDNILRIGISTGGGMIIVRKNAFIEAGRFNETLKICEDIDLGWRMVRKRSRYGMLPIYINVSSRRFSENNLGVIIVSLIGGFGSILINVWHIKWLAKFKDTFERFYGPTGRGTQEQ